MRYFVTAIHTDSGKTITSAIFCAALKADYWKPVQSGSPHDSDAIRMLVDPEDTFIHKESYQLKTPASPHAAAAIDGIALTLDNIEVPHTTNNLIIEGAGGILVPLNKKDFVIDIAIKVRAEVILVANLYLGSINHTLLSYEALRQRNVKVKGIVFNGEANFQSEDIILHHTQLPCLLRVRKEERIDRNVIYRYAEKLKQTWQ